MLRTSSCFTEDDRPDLSLRTKEAIRNIHRNFASNREDDLHLHSLTPASSLSLDSSDRSVDSVNLTPIDPAEPLSSFIVQMQDSLTSGLDSSMMPKLSYDYSNIKPGNPFEDDREVPSREEFDLSYQDAITDDMAGAIEDSSAIVELLPEASLEMSNFIYKSIEAPSRSLYHKDEANLSSSSGDEGPALTVLDRVFLADTASKNRLSARPAFRPFNFYKLEPKILTQSTTFMESIHTTSISTISQIECPDMNSPILRKLVVCEERGEEGSIRRLQIVGSVGCSGYNSAPALEFSNIEGRSRGFVSYNKATKHILTSLCAAKVVQSFMQVQVSWVVCGFEHCALVTSSGEVRTWGYGASGCLGHGDTNSYSTPTTVADLKGTVVVYMECGGYHTAAITQQGELYVWGRGDVHQLGVPMRHLSKDEMGYVALRPTLVEEFNRTKKKLRGVACGEAHTLVLDSEGSVYAFGWAEDGQLGLQKTELKNSIMTSSVRKISALIRHRIIKVSAGSIFSAALDDAGQVFVWGNGEQGQLGLGNRIKFAEFPTQVEALSSELVIDIVCGESHVFCITQSGKLFGWGQGLAGLFDNKAASGFIETFPTGSDLVCYVPRRLAGVDIAHRMIVPGSIVQKKKKQQLPKATGGKDLFAALHQKLLSLGGS
jgi:X-linked retinitis pigmentosa GTPase regulator